MKHAITLCLILITQLLLAQTIDVQIIGEEKSEKPHLWSITSNDEVLIASTEIDESNSTGFYQIIRTDFEGEIMNYPAASRRGILSLIIEFKW